MKVTNNKIGPAAGQLDSGRAGKTEGSRGLLDGGKTGGTKNSAAAASSENVNVSERAQMMQKAKDIASQTTVDEGKVARLQKMIDEGKYKTDARAIADKLVDSHLEIPD